MEGGARIALGVGIGYLLGRTRKMRFALSLAGAAMSRRGAGGPGELLKRGTSLLESSELSQITDTVRGELLGAVRSAAVTAASNRIDALNARLQQQSAAPEDEEDRGGDRKTETDEGEDVHEPSDEQEPAEEDREDEYPAEEEAEDDTERPATRTRTRRASPAKTSKTGSRSSDRASDTAERRTSTPRRRRARDEADEAPVRRTRR